MLNWSYLRNDVTNYCVNNLIFVFSEVIDPLACNEKLTTILYSLYLILVFFWQLILFLYLIFS